MKDIPERHRYVSVEITTDNITSIVGDKLSRNKVEGAQRDRTLALLKGYQHG
jgi:hypothetical protein